MMHYIFHWTDLADQIKSYDGPTFAHDRVSITHLHAALSILMMTLVWAVRWQLTWQAVEAEMIKTV